MQAERKKAIDRGSTGGEASRAQTKRGAKCVKAEVSERGGVRPLDEFIR